MRFLVVIPPKDFRDESLSLMTLFLKKWGVDYDISSYTSSDCVGMHGAVSRPAVHAARVSTKDYGGIVVIDGSGIDSYKLFDYRPLLDLMIKFNDSGKYVIGIGNAVKVQARANIINGRPAAIPPSDVETKRLVMLFHGVPSDKPFVIADNLITIRDSASMEEAMPEVLDRMRV